jgi:alpha-ketoglutarate-dependent taurine dioxygenase
MGDRVRTALEESGAAYVEKVRSDRALLELARQLGEVAEAAVDSSSALQGPIYSVQPRLPAARLSDGHGHLLRSSTGLEFPLHTDGYNVARTIRYVLLLRVDNSDEQAPTHVSDSKLALAQLSQTTLAALGKPVFPSGLGSIPLVGAANGDSRPIRFSQEEIDRWAPRCHPLNDLGLAAIFEFHRALMRVRHDVLISQGDCLVIDNQRMCHGRGALANRSRRELRRVWVT